MGLHSCERESPRRKAVASQAGCFELACSGDREAPRDKPVASGTSPWHLFNCAFCAFLWLAAFAAPGGEKAAGGATAFRDDFGEDGESYFFRGYGADVEADGSVDVS